MVNTRSQLKESDNNTPTTEPAKIEEKEEQKEVNLPPAEMSGKYKVCIPDFNQSRPDLWLRQIESQFRLGKVTEEQEKFDLVFSKLPENVVSRCSDILAADFIAGDFQRLTDALLQRYGLSDPVRRNKVLDEMQYDDNSRPSQYFQDLISTAGTAVDYSIVVDRFLKRIPVNIRTAIATSASNLLEEYRTGNTRTQESQMLRIADDFAEMNKSANVSATQARPPARSQQYARRTSPRHPSKFNGQMLRRMPFDPNGSFCRNHFQYGATARNCNDPQRCRFLSNPSINDITDNDGDTQIKMFSDYLCNASSHFDLALAKRLVVRDRISGRQCLMDTGSDLTLFRYQGPKRKPLPGFRLFAANGTIIPVYSVRQVILDFGLKRTFPCRILEAGVNNNIIGVDFFHRHNISVNIRGRELVDNEDNSRSRGIRKTVNQLSVFSISPIDPRIMEIINEKTTEKIIEKPKHFIITEHQRPLRERARRANPEKIEVIKKHFQKMVKEGHCRPSSSAWATPVHLVPKPNGEWRVCGDYRRLNQITVHDAYPIKNLQDFADSLAGCTIFSKIDLQSAFYNIEMDEESISKTAVITPVGLFEYLRMPFGLRNAAQTFQRIIDGITADLPFVYAYIDDLLICSRTEAEHIEHVKTLIRRLKQNGLVMNLGKCEFLKTNITFLGHQISATGLSPLKDRVQAIANFPQPQTVKALQRFIGMLNFYRRFIPHLSGILTPLFELYKEFNWTTKCTEAFEKAKTALSNATALGYPTAGPMIITTDASDIASGAVLEQNTPSGPVPLGFMSKKFSETEKRYAAFDRELLAIHQAILHFRHFIEGRQVHIFTDHKPLIAGFKKVEKRSPRQSRMFGLIAEFTNSIHHIEGKKNIVADALSRTECANIELYSEDWLAEQQKKAAEELKTFAETNKTELKTLKLKSGKTLICFTGEGRVRPFVPESCRQRVFEAVHSLSHPSIRQSRKLVTERFYWPSMNAEVGEMAKNCVDCQTAKVQSHIKLTPVPIAVPPVRFKEVNCDIVGPLPTTKEGYKYLLTAIDRFSRFPEAYPLKTVTAEVVTDTLHREWFSRYGYPDTIYTDQGVQYASALFKQFCSLTKTAHVMTTPYNPRANGMIERFHRTLKHAIMARGTDWYDSLPFVLLGLRTTEKEDLKCSPAELVYGVKPRLPADISLSTPTEVAPDKLLRDLHRFVKGLQKTPTRAISSTPTVIPKDYKKVKHVFLKAPNPTALKKPYTGPFPVIEHRPRTLIIQHANGPMEVGIERPSQLTYLLTYRSLYLVVEGDPGKLTRWGAVAACVEIAGRYRFNRFVVKVSIAILTLVYLSNHFSRFIHFLTLELHSSHDSLSVIHLQ